VSLDLSKLEKVRELAGGIVQARCPACAEGGHDVAGEHLRIYPDGRFGCCVYPKDRQHRKRIFALAGVKEPAGFALRVKTPAAVSAGKSVTAALSGFSSGTLGTAKTESEIGVPNVPALTAVLAKPNSGTLGTGHFRLRAYTRGELLLATEDFLEKLKDSECAVPSVPRVEEKERLRIAAQRLPFLTAAGDLVIPFDSPERYHWWKGGQSVAATLAEVKERMSCAAAF
jgi:hypothetical protein